MALTQRDLDRMRDMLANVAPVDTRPFLSPRELGARLSLSRRTVEKLLADGVIASHKVAGSRRVAQADLDAYLESCRQDAA